MLQFYGGNTANSDGGGSLPTFTEGSVLFAATDGSITEDNDSLFYDNSLNRLGIGTSSPSYKLQVFGSNQNLFGVENNGIIRLNDNLRFQKFGNISSQSFLLGSGNPIAPEIGAGETVVLGIRNSPQNFSQTVSVGVRNTGRGGVTFGINNNHATQGITVGTNNTVSGFANGVHVYGTGNSYTVNVGNLNQRTVMIGYNISIDRRNASSNYNLHLGRNLTGFITTGKTGGVAQIGYNYNVNNANAGEFVFDATDTARDAAGLHFAAYEKNQLSIGFNTSDLDAAASNLIALRNGTQATTAPTKTTILQSANISAGNTTISLATEGTGIVQNVAGVVASRTITIAINGTLYDLLAVPTATP